MSTSALKKMCAIASGVFAVVFISVMPAFASGTLTPSPASVASGSESTVSVTGGVNGAAAIAYYIFDPSGTSLYSATGCQNYNATASWAHLGFPTSLPAGGYTILGVGDGISCADPGAFNAYCGSGLSLATCEGLGNSVTAPFTVTGGVAVVIPSSTYHSIQTSASTQVSDPGLLKILLGVAGVYLGFWFIRFVVGIIPRRRRKK